MSTSNQSDDEPLWYIMDKHQRPSARSYSIDELRKFAKRGRIVRSSWICPEDLLETNGWIRAAELYELFPGRRGSRGVGWQSEMEEEPTPRYAAIIKAYGGYIAAALLFAGMYTFGWNSEEKNQPAVPEKEKQAAPLVGAPDRGDENIAPPFPDGPPGWVARLEGHTDPFQFLLISPDGRHAVSSAGEKSCLLWDVVEGKQIGNIDATLSLVYCGAFLDEGKQIILGGSGRSGGLSLVDVQQRSVIKIFKGHTASVKVVSLLPDQQHFISVSLDGTARLWEISSGKELRQHKFPDYSTKSRYVAAFPFDDGSLLVHEGATGDKNPHNWKIDADLNVEPFSPEPEHFGSAAYGLAVTARAKQIAFPIPEKEKKDLTAIVEFIPETNSIRNIGSHKGKITDLKYVPGKDMLVSAAQDKTIRIWNPKSSNQITEFSAPDYKRTMLAMSPSGRFILSADRGQYSKEENKFVGNGDYSINIWRLPTSVTPIPGTTIDSGTPENHASTQMELSVGKNLIENPGCEETIRNKTIPGWTITSGNWTSRTKSPSPASGKAYFYPGVCSQGTLVQNISLPDPKSIDAGLAGYQVAAQLRSFDQSNPIHNDLTEARFDFFSENGETPLSTIRSGLHSSTKDWRHFKHSGVIPEGTRRVRVTLYAERATGKNNDGYFDDIQFSLMPAKDLPKTQSRNSYLRIHSDSVDFHALKITRFGLKTTANRYKWPKFQVNGYDWHPEKTPFLSFKSIPGFNADAFFLEKALLSSVKSGGSGDVRYSYNNDEIDIGLRHVPRGTASFSLNFNSGHDMLPFTKRAPKWKDQWNTKFYIYRKERDGEPPDMARILKKRPLVEHKLNHLDFAWEEGVNKTQNRIKGVPEKSFVTVATRKFRTSDPISTFLLRVFVDDGVRIKIDGKQVMDHWKSARVRVHEKEITLAQGDHDLHVEFYDIQYIASLCVYLEKID